MEAFVISHWYLFLALFVVLGLIVIQPLMESASGIPKVTSHEAVRLINREAAVIVDVREPSEFQTGHIARAINIPLGQMATRSQELKKFKERPIVMCCASGARSARAATVLRKEGFADVRNLSGGISAWRTQSLPVES